MATSAGGSPKCRGSGRVALACGARALVGASGLWEQEWEWVARVGGREHSSPTLLHSGIRVGGSGSAILTHSPRGSAELSTTGHDLQGHEMLQVATDMPPGAQPAAGFLVTQPRGEAAGGGREAPL